MAHVTSVSAHPAEEDLWALVAFYKDAEAVERRAQEIKDLTAAANEAVARIGPAEEIDRLRIQAKADRQMAAETLRAAELEAKAIQGKALEIKDLAERSIGDLRTASARDEAYVVEKLKAREKALTVREQDAAAAMKIAEQLAADATTRLETAERLRAEFSEKLDRLRQGLLAVTG